MIVWTSADATVNQASFVIEGHPSFMEFTQISNSFPKIGYIKMKTVQAGRMFIEGSERMNQDDRKNSANICHVNKFITTLIVLSGKFTRSILLSLAVLMCATLY